MHVVSQWTKLGNYTDRNLSHANWQKEVTGKKPKDIWNVSVRSHTAGETCDEMKATRRDDAPSCDIIKHCHRQFVRRSVEMSSIPGRPRSAINESVVRQMEAAAILEDRCLPFSLKSVRVL